MTDAVQAAFIGAIVGAAVSGIVALLTTVLNNHYAENRRKAEGRKWYAEHFLSRKIEALSVLYASIIEALAGLHQANKTERITEVSLARAQMTSQNFEMKQALAWVYLEEPDRAPLRDFKNELLHAWVNVVVAHYSETEETIERPRFGDENLKAAYKAVVERLEKLLSPEVLKGIQPDK
ncbi:MAG: hypothetical protein IH953_02845 [Chloroflexi bacterium]|nr:hypothetical protein [Chloroflexota bacterium]